MLRVYHSNRLEALLERLSAVLSRPLARTLEPEVIVAQNRGMARWLSLNLASSACLGVAANIRFELPATFVWAVYAGQLDNVPEQAHYHREDLTWRCMAVLPAMLERPEFEALRHYLSDDPAGLKSYQLCRRVADAFDQYLVYRPDLILDWDAGREQGWQASLWRALTATIDSPHRAELWRQFRSRQGEQGLDAEVLPERVCVFGISALAPTYLEVLARLGHVIPVHLFVLNPSLAYWGDIVPVRDQARIRALRRRHQPHAPTPDFDVGNPLLASFGKQGREFQAQIHADVIGGCRLDEELRNDVACFVPPLRWNAAPERQLDMLRTLQLDILMLQDRGGPADPPPMPAEPDDRSLQIHACHSPMREIEVLHDQLLALFDEPPGGVALDPREVVVMAPAIEDYADCVKAVFGGAPETRQIPWAIADRSAGSEYPLVGLFLRLLALGHGRFGASEVLSILEVPAVSRRFGIDSQGLELARAWVADSGIRWGYDGSARAELGLPGCEDNTWKLGLQRLLLGYAMAEDAPAFRSLEPWGDVEGGEAEVLGKLKSFVDSLESTRRGLKSRRTVPDWRRFLTGMLDTLLEPQPEEELALQLIANAVASFADRAAAAGFGETLDVDTVAEHLGEALAGPSRYQSFLSGAVTFCSMVPMRSIPFRVVCLLGMSEASYPRQQIVPSFDRVAHGKKRLGDRSRRDDDRYLFLEALLSARDIFYLSYVGRGLRDNAVLQPAGVVSELLEQLEKSFTAVRQGAASESSEAPLRRQVVTDHRLQPFSGRYFEPGGELFSYASEWLPPLAPDPGERSPGEVFFPRPLSETTRAQVVELEDLLRFYHDPAQFLLGRRLSLELSDGPEPLDDSEVFRLGGLDRYRVRDQLLRYCLERGVASDEMDEDLLRAAVRERSSLPVGPFAELAIATLSEEVAALLAALEGYRATPVDAVDEHLCLGETALHVKLDSLTDRGLVDCRAGRVRNRHRLGLWIRHLALNALAPSGCERRSLVIGLGDRGPELFALRPAGAARERLEELLELFRLGQLGPLRYFPESSWAYAAARAGGAVEAAAMRAAYGEWQKTGVPGEAENPYLRTAFRGLETFDDRFRELARRIVLPALEAVEVAPDTSVGGA